MHPQPGVTTQPSAVPQQPPAYAVGTYTPVGQIPQQMTWYETNL